MHHIKCRKCGSTHRISWHHVLPRVFFRGKGMQIPLCCRHHRIIEFIICGAEMLVGDVEYGQRFKLPEDDYQRIAERFTHSTI